MSNNIKFNSTFDKIDFDIQMKSYYLHNNDIATINDYLGDYYSYSDLRDAEEYQLSDEKNMYRDALKEYCGIIDRAIEYINSFSVATIGRICGKTLYTTHLRNIENILKGDRK